jgi:arylsulfatase A
MWLLQLNEDMYPKMPDMSMRYREYTLIGRMPPRADSVPLLNWMYQSLPEKFELYNITKDPGQQFDIADKHPQLLKKLIPKMTKMWINIRDEGKMNAAAFKPQK